MLLNPKGIIAHQEKHILLFSAALMLVVVVPVIFMCLFFAWRYRESNTKAKYTPDWSHSTAIEVVVWTIPCIIILILGIVTWTSSHELDPYRPLDSNAQNTVTVQAIALDWKWLFIYPDYNIATVNYVQLPVNTPIRFLITADGAMNSLQIPQLAGQIYAMAGMQSKLHLQASHTGEYRGFSANYSGEGFSDMNFRVKVSSREEFMNWVKTVRQSSSALTMNEFQQLVKPSNQHSVTYYSTADKNIYAMETMKSMMPASTHMMADNTTCSD